MAQKYNVDRRHHMPKMSFKVQNWPEFEVASGQRPRNASAVYWLGWLEWWMRSEG
jgi:hypothetical protein